MKGDDPLRGSEIGAIGHAEKEAVVDHTRHVVQGTRQCEWVPDRSKAAVGDEVAIVADHRLALSPPQRDPTITAHLRHQLGKLAQRGTGPERHDLDGKGKGSERRDLLRPIGDDHQPPGVCGNDFFPDQRSAAPLDQIKLGIDLVGAIDGEIERPDLVPGANNNPSCPCFTWSATPI